MRQRFAIFITVVLVLALLVAFNAASYVRIEQTPDSEYNPDRSTYNAGATGTRALYDFLHETGRKVMRWREAPASLLTSGGQIRPTTFVVIGSLRVPFKDEEEREVLRWVERGGRLILIDRRSNISLIPNSGDWRITTEIQNYPSPDAQSDNAEAMTAGVSLARPAQPTSLMRGVDSVLPSRFAGIIKVWTPEAYATDGTYSTHSSAPVEEAVRDTDDEELATEDETAPPPAPTVLPEADYPVSKPVSTNGSPAPVVHLTDHRGALLVDYPHGAGRIILLSDPFIVANAGISRADNLQLAINTLAGEEGGLIAFDEFHQGRGETENRLLAYFAGTPVVPLLAQFSLIVVVILWSRGRRFARPLPLPQVDRRSKLEFVASMAELQHRARAYDLAIENIYARTRRVLARYAGVDSYSPRAEIARRVAERSKLEYGRLETLMRECEDAMAGAPLSTRKALELVARLREVERALGLRLRSREIRQAKER
jgi:hypothetical protein